MKKIIGLKNTQREKGLTLLEYAAGAAFILATATIVMTALQGSMTNAFNNLGTWIETITTQDAGTNGTNGTGSN